jgi:hypothetical protein
VWARLRRKWSPVHHCWRCKVVWQPWEIEWQFLKKLNVESPRNSVFKKKEILTYATMLMDLEDITLSEISQSPKDRYYMIPLK